MGVAERYNKKLNKDSSSRLGVAERYELGLLENEINSFITTNNNLFTTAEEDSKHTGYRANSQDWYNNYKSQVDTQKQISKSLKNKLQKYSSYLDDDFKTKTSDYLSSLDTHYSNITDYAKGQYDYFSKFKDEDDYKKALEGQKVREEQLVFDTKKGQEELDAYEDILKNVSRAEMFLNQYKGKKPTPNDMSEEAWAQYLDNKSWIDQYGSSEKVKAEINKRRAYLTQAKRLQEFDKLTNNATKSEDFDEFSKIGANIVNPTNAEAEGWLTIGGGLWGKNDKDGTHVGGKSVGNIVTYSRDNASAIQLGGSGMVGNHKYKYMTEDEVGIYNYYLAKENEGLIEKGTAQNYLDLLDDTLNQREGGQLATNMEDNTALELAFGIVAGTDQFKSGVKNLFNTDDDYISPSAFQYASGMVREDLKDNGPKIFGNSLGQIGYDFITTTTNMLPSIAVSTAVGTVSKTAGAALGASLMGASASGNAYADMVNAGYSKDQARTYSTLVGASEAALQYALGGIAKLGSGAIGKVTGKALEGIAKGINSANIQFAIKYGGQFVGNLLGEGLEESLQEVFDPFFKSIATGEKAENVDWEQVAYSGMLGMLSAGLLEGVGSVATRGAEIGQARDIKKEGNWETLKDIGTKFSADSIAYKIADKVNEKTGAYKLSMLLHDVNANLSEQNRQDIEKALVDNGFAEGNAKSISKWLGKAVEGGNLTKTQQMALEDNSIISKVFKEVIIDKNSTVNQRLQAMMELNGVKGQAGVDLDALKESTTNKEAISNKINIRNAFEDPIKRMADATAREQLGLISVADIGRESMLDSLTNDVSGKVDAIKLENAIEKAYQSKTPIENAIREGNKVSEENGVTVKKITEIGNDGKMMVQTDDGTVEDANDIQYKSNDGAYIILATSDMATKLSGLGIDLDVTSANAVVNGFSPNSGISAIDYMKGAEAAIRYGVIGYKRNAITKNSPYHNLTKSQQDYLYKIGRDIAQSTTDKDESRVKGSSTSTSNKSKNGKVTKAIKSKLKPNQSTDISTVEKLSEAGILKNNFYIFESKEAQVNIKGEYKTARVFTEDVGEFKAGAYAPNGIYQTANGDIYIDINSGANGEGLTLYTLAHELGHFVKHQNPTGFKVLADFVSNELGSELENLIQNKLNLWKQLGRTEFGYMDAYEDVICDALEPMFTDGNLAQRLVEKAKTTNEGKGLLKTLKEFFSNLYKRIQQAYAKLNPQDPAAVEMKKHQKTIGKVADMFAEAIVGANENFDNFDVQAQKNTTEDGDVKLQARSVNGKDVVWIENSGFTNNQKENFENNSQLANIDTETKSVSPKLSERTWTSSEYVTEREKTAKAISEALGVTTETALKYIDDINSVARLISDDRVRLDYDPNIDDKATVLKPNSEYGYSVDMSTLCAKRLLTTGTFDAIQRLLPNTVFDSDDIVHLREMMLKRGYEVACGICYVESTRREMGAITQEFINRYKESQKTGKPITRINSEGKIVDLKKTKEQQKTTADKSNDKFFADKDYTPTLAELNTTDIDLVKRDHPLVYEAYLNFMNARGQSKPKLLETRAEYKGEILRHFAQKKTVNSRNNAGGLRLQSFSDFEVPHLIDMMQIIMDMSRVGLKSQAYTKVPAFAEVFGGTGVKINLSLIAKDSGLDSNGNLIFDDVEGINHEEAFKIREKFSKNVGTILVGKNDAHIIAAMADPRIDYIIPFHKSSWKESLYEALGLTGYDDYTNTQNEKSIDGSKIKNYDPSEYWDFTKSGDENAQIYLEKCRKEGRIPKFPQFQSYPGYWKLLIDFKMYDNDGVGSPQEVVRPTFEMDAANEILNEYKGGHRSFPVAKDVVEDFVKEYKEGHKGIKFSDRDSEGNILTKEQQEFFKDSKVRDENGNLKIMYHGSPNANFTVFKSGTYFTEHKWYADVYQNRGASSLGYKKTADNPDTYAVYLDIKKPFDTRNKTERDIFYNEYYRQWGTGTDLMESGLPDWMDGQDLQEFLEENGYDYDGLILDEGGTGGYGEEVTSRGLSYVVFSPEQVKNIDNKNPTTDPDIRFSDRDIRLNSRNLLANALESSVKNETEREWLNKYKAQINALNEDQKRLDEINAEIKTISFTKGSDRSKLAALNNNKKTLTARITRADKKLLDFEASKPLKNVLEVEKKRAVQRAKNEAKENLKAERKEFERILQNTKDKYTERIERSKEGRDKTELRHKIKKVVSYLNSILNRGTKERNVKLGLQDTVSRALATAEVLFSDEITNADIVRLGVESVTDKEMKYLEEYNNLLNQLESAKEEDIQSIKAKISRLNSLLKNVFVRERARLNRQTVDYALNSLADAYRGLKESTDDYVKNNAFVEGMYDRIISLKDGLKGVTIKDMSFEQLKSVYDIYSMVKHMVTEANSIFRQGRAEDLATFISNVQGELDAILSIENDTPDIIEKMKDPIRSFTWNNLKPYYAFERLGSKTFEQLYWDVVEADGVWAKDVDEAANIIEESRKKHGYKQWDMKTARTFKSSNGLDFKLTLGDMMSIYAYSKRPQAEDHMTIGGFAFDTGSTYKEKKTKNGVTITYRRAKLSKTYKVDPKLISDVIAELEKIEGAKEYVDEMQSYLTKFGEKGNEVSRILFGIDLFKEKVYFPLQSAKDYRSSIEQTLNATQTMASLKNTGVSKETVPHANNPIVLRSFDDIVLEHINTMSKYHAYVIPIENLSKVFNNVGKDVINGDYISTQALISSKFGNSATKYFDQFITDLNGGSFGGGASNPLAKLFGTAKSVSVAANMSVVVQQYFAIIRAMDEISPKYMTPFLNSEASKSSEKQWEELKKYAPVGIIKEIGGFDMGANRSAIDYIGDAETKIDAKKFSKKAKEWTMWAAGKMDEIGWSTIWRAVKKEIDDTTALKVGTVEFFQACGKRFTEIVTKTQVYDSVTSRSGYMRSKHESVKYLTSFLGEPTTIVNMMFSKQLQLARAIKSKDKKAIKEASQKLLRTSTVLILSTVLTSLAKSLPYAMRDDEEEEGALLERWAKHFGESTASDMNPLGMIPIGRDLVSIWEGWDVERPDMTLISDIFTTFQRALKDGCTTEEALALAGALANILGYPLKNIIRDVKGFVRLFGDITDDIAPKDLSGAFAQGFTGASSQDILWEALNNNDVDSLNKIKKKYKTESEYQSAVRKTLKENDPRIKEAAEAKYSGDLDAFKQIVLEIKAEGKFSQDDIVSAINSTVASLKKKNEKDEAEEEWYNDEPKDTEDEETSVYKNSDINDALERGDTAKAKEIIKDIVRAKVKSGKTESQAKSSIKSGLASYWKPIYLEASNDEKIEIRKMLRLTGVYSGATEIVKLTRKWEKDTD